MDPEIESFLAECGKSAPKTAQTYAQSIKVALAAIAKPLFSITKKDVIDWLMALDSAEIGISYKRLQRAAMFSLFDYLSDRHEDFKNPSISHHSFDFTKPFGEEDHSAPPLTIDQIKIILDSARLNPADYCLLMILAHCGLRISEAITIKIENIHLAERYLLTGIEPIARKSTRRSGKPLMVILSIELAAILEDYLSFINRKDGWLFPSPREDSEYMTIRAYTIRIAAYSKKTGIEFSSHSFRHSLITNRKITFSMADWESEILMNHVPKSLENRVYLGKTVDFKVALHDKYHVMAGVA